jgi:hypothetical protein
MNRLIEWKNSVKEYNLTLCNSLNKSSNFKELYYGFEVIDGKLIENPDILFVGINPGKGNGERGKDVFETEQISYLDVFDENYKSDYPKSYHLAEKTIKLFRLMGWDDLKINEFLLKKVTKTNFYYLITENIKDLETVINDINYGRLYHKKSADFLIQLMDIIKPKIVIFEGKKSFENLVKVCYEKDVWNKNNFGYFYDVDKAIHLIGYSRSRNYTNQNRYEFVKKLIEIL